MDEGKARQIKNLVEEYDRASDLKEVITNCDTSFYIEGDGEYGGRVVVYKGMPEYDIILRAVKEAVAKSRAAIEEFE